MANIKWGYALVYIDFIVVFPKTLMGHIRHIEKGRELLNSARVTINAKHPYSLAKLLTAQATLVHPAN